MNRKRLERFFSSNFFPRKPDSDVSASSKVALNWSLRKNLVHNPLVPEFFHLIIIMRTSITWTPFLPDSFSYEDVLPLISALLRSGEKLAVISNDFKHKAATQLQIVLHVGDYLPRFLLEEWPVFTQGRWTIEKKGPWLFSGICLGWNPTQLSGDYVIYHGIIGFLFNNQDSMESKGFFRGSFGFPARWFYRWKPLLLLQHHDRRHDQPNVRGNGGVGKSVEIWWWKLGVKSCD